MTERSVGCLSYITHQDDATVLQSLQEALAAGPDPELDALTKCTGECHRLLHCGLTLKMANYCPVVVPVFVGKMLMPLLINFGPLLTHIARLQVLRPRGRAQGPHQTPRQRGLRRLRHRGCSRRRLRARGAGAALQLPLPRER